MCRFGLDMGRETFQSLPLRLVRAFFFFFLACFAVRLCRICFTFPFAKSITGSGAQSQRERERERKIKTTVAQTKAPTPGATTTTTTTRTWHLFVCLGLPFSKLNLFYK